MPDPLLSVEGVIWTAVGGRATLIGPFLGTFLVRGLEFVLSGSWFANYWQFFMGVLFIAVVLWIPDGLVGTHRQLAASSRPRLARPRFARRRIARRMTVSATGTRRALPKTGEEVI